MCVSNQYFSEKVRARAKTKHKPEKYPPGSRSTPKLLNRVKSVSLQICLNLLQDCLSICHLMKLLREYQQITLVLTVTIFYSRTCILCVQSLIIQSLTTVGQQIFACRKFSRISLFSGDSRKFTAREYYLKKLDSQKFPARELPGVENRENFLSRNFPVLQYSLVSEIWNYSRVLVENFGLKM